MKSKFLVDLVKQKDCLAFAKETRRGVFLQTFGENLAARCGCPILIQLPVQFDRDEVLKIKKSEFEPGTREWLIEELVARTLNSRAAFLLSGPGMGKSFEISLTKRG